MYTVYICAICMGAACFSRGYCCICMYDTVRVLRYIQKANKFSWTHKSTVCTILPCGNCRSPHVSEIWEHMTIPCLFVFIDCILTACGFSSYMGMSCTQSIVWSVEDCIWHTHKLDRIGPCTSCICDMAHCQPKLVLFSLASWLSSANNCPRFALSASFLLAVSWL